MQRALTGEMMGWVTAGVAITAAADQTPSCLAPFLNRTCLPVDHALDEAQLAKAQPST